MSIFKPTRRVTTSLLDAGATFVQEEGGDQVAVTEVSVRVRQQSRSAVEVVWERAMVETCVYEWLKVIGKSAMAEVNRRTGPCQHQHLHHGLHLLCMNVYVRVRAVCSKGSQLLPVYRSPLDPHPASFCALTPSCAL